MYFIIIFDILEGRTLLLEAISQRFMEQLIIQKFMLSNKPEYLLAGGKQA